MFYAMVVLLSLAFLGRVWVHLLSVALKHLHSRDNRGEQWLIKLHYALSGPKDE